MIDKKDIKIGLKFKRTYGRKHPYIETIIDILKTYNAAGELVNTRYVAEHDFMGQKVMDYDINMVSIQRAEYVNEQPQETPNIKKFRSMDGIGKAKYTVSYHDGISTHNDGSEFWGMAIFSNKKKRDAYIKELKSNGYIYA